MLAIFCRSIAVPGKRIVHCFYVFLFNPFIGFWLECWSCLLYFTGFSLSNTVRSFTLFYVKWFWYYFSSNSYFNIRVRWCVLQVYSRLAAYWKLELACHVSWFSAFSWFHCFHCTTSMISTIDSTWMEGFFVFFSMFIQYCPLDFCSLLCMPMCAWWLLIQPYNMWSHFFLHSQMLNNVFYHFFYCLLGRRSPVVCFARLCAWVNEISCNLIEFSDSVNSFCWCD